MRAEDLTQLLSEELGWTTTEVVGFSLRALRDIVRKQPPSKRRERIIATIDAREAMGTVLVARRRRN